jgi:galactose-1-phosphate uridylyltransferase
MTIVQKEVGISFEKVLDCAGVFKQDTGGNLGIKRFLDSL